MSDKKGLHSDLIYALGGAKAVADYLAEKLQLTNPITPQAVSNWHNRGVPWYARPALAERARGAEIALPPGFLGAQVRPA